MRGNLQYAMNIWNVISYLEKKIGKSYADGSNKIKS